MDVCDHIDKNHPDLWFIHNESSFHGWYTRGKQKGDLGNRTFVDKHVKNYGALGKYFVPLKGEQLQNGRYPLVCPSSSVAHKNNSFIILIRS